MHEVVAPLRERVDGREEARDPHAQSPRRRGRRPPTRRAGAGRPSGSVPITSTSKPGTPRSRSSSSVCVTPCMEPTPSATSATRSGSCSRPSSLLFSRPRNAAAGTYGMAGMQAEKTASAAPCAPASRSPAASITRSTAYRSLRSCARHARRKRSACAKPSSCIQASSSVSEVSRPSESSQDRSSARASPGQRSAAIAPGARVALAHHALDDAQHDARVGGLAAVAAAERADGQRHRGVRPLGSTALGAAGDRVAAAQPAQKLFRSRRGRRLGPGPPDVDSGVVVRTADAGAAVGLDVDGGGHVQLARAGAIAGLPDGEQAREPAAVARRERRGDRVERMGEGAGDAVAVQVLGHLLDVARVRLEPVVVVRRDPPAQDVDRLRLAAEVAP